MRKRYRILLAILLVGVISGIVWQSLRQREPVYQGKSLSKWLEGYSPAPRDDNSLDEQSRWQETNRAVQQIGTNAIPSLLRMLRATDTSLKLGLLRVAREQRLFKIRYTYAAELNMRASMAFMGLQGSASNAVPALIQIYQENLSEYSQNAVINAFLSIGPTAAGVVPCLVGATTNSNSSIRRNALVALGAIHAQPELSVPVLTTALRDPDVVMRRMAARSLRDFGKDAKAAVPALLELLKDKDIPASSLAADALVRIDPEAAAKAGATGRSRWE